MEFLWDKEISQENNSNATTRLWIQPNGNLYKQYVIWNPTTFRNILTLLTVGRSKRLRCISEIVTAEKIIFSGPIPVGYLMEYCQGQTLWAFLADNNFPHSVKRDCFRNLAAVINRMPKHIFIGDLHGANVIVSEDGAVRIIDVDGFSFPGNEISCPMACVPGAEESFPLKKYWHHMGKFRISRDSDILCFFFIFLQWLMGSVDPAGYTTGELLRYIDYLAQAGFPTEIVQMMRRLFEDGPNFIAPEPFSRIDSDKLEDYTYHAFRGAQRE